MPTESPDRSYYCTRCHIETVLAPVCPKCHRKTTLRPRGDSDGGGGGARRRASSGQVQAAGTVSRWVWYGGGGLAVVALVALVWWGLSGRRSAPNRKKTGPAVTRSFGQQSMASDRVFGAPRPGARVAPPPPPRICGTAYGVAIHYRFSEPAARKGPKKPTPKAHKKAGMKAGMKAGTKKTPRAKRQGPEVVEHKHRFLLARSRGRLAYVPLAFEIRITVGGRTFTGLKLDRTGGVLPDRRTRRPRRLGFHDSLQPGLRISDLIGRIQADLAGDGPGGLKVTRQRLKNRLVSQWLQTGIGLATFLHPRPPKPGARTFEDRRLPPAGILPGLSALVRRFRLQPPKKKNAAGGPVSYGVDAPVLSRRRAKSKVPLRGGVTLTPGEVLPRKAELTLENLPRKGGGTQTVTLRLDHLGNRCNDQ